jgi:hypothetical protein
MMKWNTILMALFAIVPLGIVQPSFYAHWLMKDFRTAVPQNVPQENSLEPGEATSVSPSTSIDTLCDDCRVAHVGPHFTCVARIERHMNDGFGFVENCE